MHVHAQDPERHFWTYILPAMASQMLTGFFIIVDGFFIGQNLGDQGLAAINLLWPLPALVLAVGLGLGSGGSVLMAAMLGAGRPAEALRARGNAMVCLAASTPALMAALWFSYPALLRWLGAEGELYRLADEYCRIVILLCGAQVFNSGLNPLLRAMGRTVAAMGIMIAGLLANILLDWLFIAVFQWGMAGAAWATVAAQALGAVLQAVALATAKGMGFTAAQFRPSGRLVRQTVQIGVSPFGLSLSTNVLIIFYNWQCLQYGGAAAVAAYAIMSYLLGSLQPLLSGVGEGAQPLMSLCFGAGNRLAQKRLLRRCLRLVLLLSCVLCAGTVALRGVIPVVFGASPDTAAGAGPAVVCAGLCLPLWGVARLFSSYFYATGQSKKSLALIFGDPLVASPLCLYTLPLVFGQNGIWYSAIAAQVLLCAVLAILLRRDARRDIP